MLLDIQCLTEYLSDGARWAALLMLTVAPDLMTYHTTLKSFVKKQNVSFASPLNITSVEN